MPRFFAIAIFVATLLGVGSGVAYGDTVSISSAQRAGFGRMVFSWPAPVGHTSEINNGSLIVRFSRPIETNMASSIRIMEKYFSTAEIGADASSVVFRLKGDFGLRSYDSGKSVVVDILDSTPDSTSRPAAEAITPATNSANATNANQQQAGPITIGVRTGLHKGFTRVVFDLPQQFAYSANREGENIDVLFQASANVDVGLLANGKTPFVSDASATQVGGATKVNLAIDPTSRIRQFRIERRVVVDVYAPGTIDGAVLVKNTDQQPKTDTPTLAEKPGVIVPAKQAVEKQNTENQNKETVSEKAEPIKTEPATTKPEETQTAQATQTNETPVSLEPEKEAVEIPSVQVSNQASGDNATETLSEVRAQIIKSPDGAVDLQFDWEEPVGAAVFNRAGYLWVAFDKRALVNVQGIAAEGKPAIQSAEHIETEKGTVLRIKTADEINPEVKRSGLSWVFEFVRAPMLPSVSLETSAQPNSPLGSRLFISVPEPSEVIVIKDPSVGDSLAVVPVIPLGHGIGRTWSYPQVKLLRSKQGIVVQPLGDDLRVRPLKQGVEVTSASSLQISPVTAEELANVKLEAILAPGDEAALMKPLTRILDLEKWNRADLKSFIYARQALQLEISKSRNDKKLEETRMELARFYFANAFSAETLGVIKILIEKNPELEKNQELVLMRGASSMLMGRLADARTDIYSEILNGSDESDFWRAALEAEEGKLAEVAFDLRRTGAITRPYTNGLKMPMATLVASAAVEIGDIKQANSYIDILNLEKPNPSQQNQIDFVSAKLLKLEGNFEGAIGKFEEAMEGAHRPTRAKAAIARAQLLQELERFSNQDMIEEYEKLRFSWRGDEFEFWLLRSLGQMYSDAGMYREALQALKQAATYFRDYKESSDVTRNMSELFQSLYLDGTADELAPVTAIALYDEYRELTPAGDKGDEMIRKLADRLVDVDLLDRASDLLEGQVEFRLKGVEKARVGARLALIYLFDRKFDDALRVLNASDEPGQPEDLVHNRLMLRARAMVKTGQGMDVLEMLKGDPTADSNEIRAEIYWQQKDWKNASKVLGKLVRSYGAKSRKPLNDRQAYMVLRWAVSETLLKNENAIERILENYGDAMFKSPYASVFKIIANPPEEGLVDFRGIGEILNEVEIFQNFMETYQDQLTAKKLSELY